MGCGPAPGLKKSDCLPNAILRLFGLYDRLWMRCTFPTLPMVLSESDVDNATRNSPTTFSAPVGEHFRKGHTCVGKANCEILRARRNEMK